MSETTQAKLAHHTFSPWRVDGDRRIVAGEREWDAVKGLDIVAQHMHQTRRVMVGVDVFEDFGGSMRDDTGDPMMIIGPPELQDGDFPGEKLSVQTIRQATMQDVRDRLFRTIDVTPNLDWLVFTRWPENVLPTLERMSNRLSLVDCWLTETTVPSNIWLGTSVDDQATADARIPHLLKVPAKVRMVRYSGVGRVEFKNVPGLNKLPGVHHIEGRGRAGIDWLIISGEVGPGARPCNLEHVRDAMRQCKAAGVPVWVERLGSRPAREDGRRVGAYDREEGFFPRCSRCGHFDFGPCGDGTLLCNGCDSPWGGLRHPHGADPAEWLEDLRIREVPTCN